MSGKFRAAADLSYYTQQAMRHAIMLELYQSNALPLNDALYLVVQDLEKCARAIEAYRKDIVELEKQHDDSPF